MADIKPIPLSGRLAIQLKMLTQDEVQRAIAESDSSGNPRLMQVFLQMGLLDREQASRLQQVQKDLIEKHRAKKGGAVAPSSAPAGAAPRAVPKAAPAAPSPPASPPERPAPAEIHEAAEYAAESAAPMTSREVEALNESPA